MKAARAPIPPIRITKNILTRTLKTLGLKRHPGLAKAHLNLRAKEVKRRLE